MTLIDSRSWVLVGALLLGACSLSSPAPPLVAASNFLHPPFSSRDATGVAVGLEVELLTEAARRLGRDVSWVERPFGELLSSVVGGEVDVAASTIGITEERARLVSFSAPYFETTIVVLVRIGDGEPKTLDALAERRVATERATTAVPAAAARIPAAERVLERSGEKSWAQMLSAGSIDAIVLDRSHAETFMADAGTRFHIIDEPLRVERFAFALRKGQRVLRAALDAVIHERGGAAGRFQ